MESIAAVMPTRPGAKLPAGSCDTHNHVFGPFDRYPLDFPPDYAIPLAPFESYIEMLDLVGLTRGVLVQPTQQDCSLDILLNALRKNPTRLRGIGAVRSGVELGDLEKMKMAGIVGLRFVEAPLPSGAPRPGAVSFDEIAQLAPLMRALDWSVNVWAKMSSLMESLDKILAPGLPVVFEHMGMLDVEAGLQDQGFKTMLGLVQEGRIWVKLSVCRCSAMAPEYENLRPFVDALIEANPNQLLWGSDWPFIRMQGREPDVGNLANLASRWIADPVVEHKIFVSNPEKLYQFDEVSS